MKGGDTHAPQEVNDIKARSTEGKDDGVCREGGEVLVEFVGEVELNAETVER
jgi:hypothetical protein